MKIGGRIAWGVVAVVCAIVLIVCSVLVSHEFSYAGVPYENLILTPAQYVELPFAQIEATTTYSYILNGGGKSISFFGAYDTINPRDAELPAIQKAFQAEKPDLVLIEGMPQLTASTSAQFAAQAKKMNFSQAVKDGGEDLYALKLAADANVAFESPEPPFSTELSYVESQGFSQQDIFDYYTYRVVAQYDEEYGTSTLSQYKADLAPYIQQFAQASGWSASDIQTLTQSLYADLGDHQEPFFEDESDPNPYPNEVQSEVSKVSEASSDFRDKYLFQQIEAGLQDNDRIFVVYGSGHAVRLQPALKALFGSFATST